MPQTQTNLTRNQVKRAWTEDVLDAGDVAASDDEDISVLDLSIDEQGPV